MNQPSLAVRRLHQVMLPATDLERSVAFYRGTLGASRIARFDPPGLAFFHLGDDSPAHLIYRDDKGVFGPPGTEEWMAFFRDPDGNTLALASRILRG